MALKIYKASAGSGKTYTLTVEYIKFLVKNPTAYRQILAVTFTNKATAEMKERIIQQLYGLWTHDRDSDSYLDSIYDGLEGKISKEDICRQAGIALQLILHDYSRFRVQTIDSFFQDVMRNLARELNLMPNMSIELDNKAAADQAVDHLIAGLQQGDKVLRWLESFIEERINEGKRWDVTDDTQNFGINIFNENYQQLGKRQSEMLQDNPNLIEEHKKKLRAIEDEATEQVKRRGELFFEQIDSLGLSSDDFTKKDKGICSYFNKLRKGEFLDEKNVKNVTLLNHLESPDNWCPKSSKRRAEIISIVESSLFQFLEDTEEIRYKNACIINTCRLSLKHLSKLQLLDSIGRQVTEDNREANRFMLSSTNALLHSLMDDGDANFIFEKIGSSIKHVMIDEFQDTSSMQWDNFKLLLDNILAEGNDCLIVGDVKQSIYRWRNGDWNILNRLGTEEGEFHGHIKQHPLKINRRSENNIIKFNNALFEEALPYFQLLDPREPEEEYQKLENAYRDVEQLIDEKKQGNDKGFVRVELINQKSDKDYAEETIRLLGEQVQQLHQQGIAYEQMAILLRKKNRLPGIAAYFEHELDIRLVSDEAFLLSASKAVCLLIDALRLLTEPGNEVVRASLRLGMELLHNKEERTSWNEVFSKYEEGVALPEEFEQHMDELLQLPLYELIEELYSLFKLDQVKEQDAYLLYFMDAVTQYLTNHPSDIPSFLNYWDEDLSGKSIPGTEAEGIRVLTIHKSKGLQFHTVLLPFCDWTLEKEPRHELLLWNKSIDVAPYNELEIVPISYGNTMRDSLYHDAYEKERLQLWVDNLNLLYVAVTRAEKNLVMWSRRSTESKNASATINGLLQSTMEQLSEKGIVNKEDDGIYTYGELYIDEAKKEKKVTNKLVTPMSACSTAMVSTKPKIVFRQSNRSADFIAGVSEEESPQRFINRGKLLHEVFSGIGRKEDAGAAIDRLVFEGVIGSAAEREEIEQVVERALQLPEVQDWYSGSWQLINECDIIWMEHDQLMKRRPDRVMRRGNELVVVDFKFGQPQEKYHRQVEGYINLLRGMPSYKGMEISGYLWYVDNEKTERV